MRVLVTLTVILSLFAVGAAWFVWSGAYNVAATDPHWEITRLVLEQTRKRSVEHRSRELTAPALNAPQWSGKGATDYHESCRLCHGAPGFPSEPFARGLYPSPPFLASGSVQQGLKDAEVFWVVKNGLKMTGMPSFGSILEDREIWETTAFLKRLPKLSPEEYRNAADAPKAGADRSQGPQPGGS